MATYDQLASWAGPGRVTRLRREDVVGWRLPDAMKVQLVETGIPVAPRLIEPETNSAKPTRPCSAPVARSTASPSRRPPTPRPSGPRSVSNRRPARSTSSCRTEKRLRQLGDRPVAGHPSPLRYPRHHLGAPRRARRP
ncbi:SUKH-4 family immunity protein [Actinomadura keratinilytica]